eukprot:TRINITY_DN39328_c0_g1_i1.p1 TRINITY_DN39328_c0_g1~~TRINITY_DN39328_c0_g1_i1.p1  ORF type:complete len:136 (-),score=20.40 TRINITY_DN39328_c0_g1_i1:251-658(-)
MSLWSFAMTTTIDDKASISSDDANEDASDVSGDLVHVDSFWTLHAQKVRARSGAASATDVLTRSRKPQLKHADSLMVTRSRTTRREAHSLDTSSSESESEASVLEHVDSLRISNLRLKSGRPSLLDGLEKMVLHS